MFLLALSVCLRAVFAGAASSSDDDATTTIDIFERYAGNLIYNDTDGSCIACNGSCVEEHAVSPHSWTAKLEYILNDETNYNDVETCKGYATDVAQYGVVAFTWRSSDHLCSLHVLDVTHNIAEEMINFNGFDWVEENPYNTGPLFLVRYPKETDADTVDAMCYYGLNINQTPNIAREANQMIIITVVVIMIVWNGWMNHTKNYPEVVKRPRPTEESDNEHNIYQMDSPKKDE